MNVITLQEHLDNSNLTDGLNLEYQKYVMKLILLLRRKLTEGSIMDAEKIRAELKLIVDNKTGINTNITPQLKGEIIVLFIELRVKTRATKDLKQHLEELKYLLMKMKDKEQKSIVYKVNCMILFNMEFEGFQNFIEHEDT